MAATLAAVLLPAGVSELRSSSGEHIIETPTLLQKYSPLILIPLLIPIALAIVPLVFSGKTWRASSILCTAALGVFAIIASATLGWYYLPALIVAIIAVCLPQRHPAKSK